jgi:hypothetical protein
MQLVKIRGFVTTELVVVACAISLAAGNLRPQAAAAVMAMPAYRHRLLGVFDSQSGEPIEGVEVTDLLTKTSALTTKTGTVTLVFLPDGGALVRIRKLGYQPITMPIAISPDDTTPVTVTLATTATTLPAVVTKESSPFYRSSRLRDFEERRRAGFGQFIAEGELRKNDAGKMSNVVRRFTGMRVDCKRSVCRALSTRHGSCPVTLFVDGVPTTETNLEQINVNEYAGIEFYAGGATIPPEYNRTGSACGVMLLWTRER